MTERRTPNKAFNRRAAHRLPCAVRLGDRVGALALNGQTLDLSSEQMVLLLPKDAAPGAWIEATIRPKDCHGLNLIGRVTRCRRVATGTYEVGVELGPKPPRRDRPAPRLQ